MAGEVLGRTAALVLGEARGAAGSGWRCGAGRLGRAGPGSRWRQRPKGSAGFRVGTEEAVGALGGLGVCLGGAAGTARGSRAGGAGGGLSAHGEAGALRGWPAVRRRLYPRRAPGAGTERTHGSGRVGVPVGWEHLGRERLRGCGAQARVPGHSVQAPRKAGSGVRAFNLQFISRQ